MSIICEDGTPYIAPAVFKLELEDRIEFWEDELFWVEYHLRVAQNFAEQVRARKTQ